MHGQQAIFSLLLLVYIIIYGKSLGPHRVDSERCHLLPTLHALQGQGGYAIVWHSLPISLLRA